MSNAKNFSGNIFDRFYGLNLLFADCNKNKLSVLDIGMSDGLIAYEFARHGARLVHGIEIEADRVEFCNRLFRDVPVESNFWCMDITNIELLKHHLMNYQYDIILLLGVLHKFPEQYEEVLNYLCTKCNKYLAIRGPTEFFETLKQPSEFQRLILKPDNDIVGQLNIYKKE